MFKDLHRNIRIRIYTSFMSRVVGSTIFPFMAIYFTREINATVAGILLLIQVVTQFLASLYGGHLADLLGRKKMMVVGEWLNIFAFLGLILANSPWFTSPWITFFMLLLVSVSMGFINPAAEAMLIDVSTKENRTLMYSINYWAVNLSMMVGLIIGGWFFESYFFELLICLFIMSFFTLWMTMALIQETYKPVEVNKPGDSYGLRKLIKSYKTVVKDINFLLFTLGGIAILSIEFQRNNFIAIRLQKEFENIVISFGTQFNFSLNGIKILSLLTVENTLLIVLLTTITAKIIKNKSEIPIMYTGFILFGLGYGLLAFSNNLYVLITAVAVLSVGELMYVPTRQSILAELVDDSRRGAYMAFNGFVIQIGKIFGVLGIMLGEIINNIGMGIMYVGFAVAGIVLSQAAISRKSKKIEASQVVKG
ncbi:MDR family MFS transporter [Bacillus cereus group sp. MYBK108-2]|uniref:MDR family MFS transporter n=1 Tax=unclassified Bacillus cereus group TaxID=2750818 RepID=UPI00289224B6|nr:MFS transporter [Bacillus cereus]MDA2307622.1 MFS transporter [Bacillus cereus]HDX9634245.1 MFS transporter [Bacillus cereus]HEF1897131.1 MFS transporter [Bacillus cereus]